MEHLHREVECGSAVVEMAIVLPLLLTIIFAVFDYSRFFFIRSSFSAAVAEAARAAILPDATNSVIEATIKSGLKDPINQNSGQVPTVSVEKSIVDGVTTVAVTGTIPFFPLILPQYLGIALFPESIKATATMEVR